MLVIFVNNFAFPNLDDAMIAIPILLYFIVEQKCNP